ncbi:MAG: hypothetical protein ACRD68_18535, partial [Pyrinomonadaceae bacterium]
RRADGSILTQNCPVGLRALKRRMSRMANATISTVLSFLAGVGVHLGLSRSLPVETHLQGKITTDIKEVIDPPVVAIAGEMMIEPAQEEMGVALRPHTGPVNITRRTEREGRKRR